MEKSEKTRKLVLGSLLAATVIFIFLMEEEDEIYPIQSVQSRQPKKIYSGDDYIGMDSSVYLDIDQLGKREFSANGEELFSAISWGSTSNVNYGKQKDLSLKKPAQRTVPVISKPPPLQFQYLGKIIHNNQMKIILSRSGEKIVARLGENIDDQYRIDAMDSETITLTYLPLNAEQILIINEPGKKR